MAPESYVASDLRIEGKVEGDGSLRVAGQVKGQVAISGEIVIEAGAVVDGDVRAATLIVLHGAKMRGHVEFVG